MSRLEGYQYMLGGLQVGTTCQASTCSIHRLALSKLPHILCEFRTILNISACHADLACHGYCWHTGSKRQNSRSVCTDHARSEVYNRCAETPCTSVR